MDARMIGRYAVSEVLKDGPYSITYKAVDPGLEKKVVVRWFKPAALEDPERFARLKEDARKASALNHPNLLSILEFGEAEGRPFAAAEYIPGESLAAALKRKRLRRKETISYAQQILSAMEALESAGLAHGDLRPSNVLIASDGHVKVADTGLARLLEGFRYSATSQPPGTTAESVAFLAPEVIEGQSPDTVSDIFSFGAIYYQMATGRWAFRREWAVATLDAILKEEPPPPENVSSHAPKGSDKLVARTLEKDRDQRAQSFAEVRPLVEKLRIDYVSTGTRKRAFRVENWERLLRIVFAVVLGLAVLVGAVAWWRSRPDDGAAAAVAEVTGAGGLDAEPAVSPGGNWVVYSSDRAGEGHLDLWMQRIGERSAKRLTTNTADEREPAFSPDGKWIAFRSEREPDGVYVMPASGGNEKLVAPGGRRPRFSPDGSLIAYWTGPAGLSPEIIGDYQVHVVPAQGGASRRLLDSFAAARYPVWSPEGSHLLVLGKMTPAVDSGRSDWWLAPVDGSAPVRTDACEALTEFRLLEAGQCSIPGDWRDGQVIFSIPEAGGAHLYRAAFSVANPRITQRPQRLTSGERLEIHPYFATKGRFVFTAQQVSVGIFGLALNANEGRTLGELQPVIPGSGQRSYPTMSADERILAFLTSRDGLLTTRTWNFDTGKDSAATSARQDEYWPRVSPDGTKVAFSEQRIGRYEQFVASLGQASTQLVCQDCGGAIVYDWSPDSQRLLVDYHPPQSAFRGVALIDLASGRRTPVLQDELHALTQARFSPDGKRVAFVKRLPSGRSQVQVAPFREGLIPAAEWIPVTDGKAWDTSPQWAPNGKLVYYMSNRDSNRCAWAQKLNDAYRPEGVPFVVYHFHSARRSPTLTTFNGLDLFVSKNKLLISLGEVSGSIWSGKLSSWSSE